MIFSKLALSFVIFFHFCIVIVEHNTFPSLIPFIPLFECTLCPWYIVSYIVSVVWFGVVFVVFVVFVYWVIC